MSLEEWLMQRYGAEKFASGLERVRSFVSPYLDQINRQKPLIITVAGTNGKGQTAMSLSRQLKLNKKSFALWTSPHIERVTERFVCQDGEIQTDFLRELLEAEAERAREQNVGLSFYEILWAAFLRWVCQNPVEYLVLEVGLGGRLDAVNVLDAKIVALTSISRDHQEFLGPRYEMILFEKLGVVRADSILYSTLPLNYLNEKAEKHSKTLGYQWVNLSQEVIAGSVSDFWESNEVLSERIIRDLGLEVYPRALSYQARGDTAEFFDHEFTFYGSHNPDGARKLIQLLQHKTYNFREFRFDQVWVAMSQRSERDLLVMAKIFSQFERWGIPVFFTLFDHPKAAAKSGWWKSTKAEYIEDPQVLFKQLSQTGHQKILVTGSYYFISQLKSIIAQGR